MYNCINFFNWICILILKVVFFFISFENKFVYLYIGSLIFCSFLDVINYNFNLIV